MSTPRSSQPPVLGYGRKRPYPHDIPTSTWAPRYTAHLTFSSSPQRSSSPPRTPYFSAHTYGYAHIRSSPEIGPDVAFRGLGDHSEDPSMSWTHPSSIYAPTKYPAPAYTRVPQQLRYPLDHDYPPSSDFDVLELSEEVEHDIPDLDSEPTSDSTPGQSSVAYSDSEEEETQEDDMDGNGYSFGYDSNRTTFFRTSAERGQWKSNPMPCRPVASLLQTRNSAPALSRVATPIVSLETPPRTISEPAPSITAENANFTAQKSNMPDRATEAVSSNSASIPIIPPPPTEEAQSPHTLPSLTSDRESSLDIDYHDTPSSPLPSSSPPLSHASFSVSRLSRSISPISYDRESSAMRSSSPLSELPDDEDPFDDDLETHIVSDNSDNKESMISSVSLASTSATALPESTPQSLKPVLADAVTMHVGASPTPPLLTEGNPSNAKPNLSPCEDAVMAPISKNPSLPLPELSSPITVSSSSKVQSNKGKCKEADVDKVKSAALRDKNGVVRPLLEVASTHVTSNEKRKKDIGSEGPVAKKRKTGAGSATSTSSSIGKRRIEEDENENENENTIETASEAVPAPIRKQKRKKDNSEDAAATIASTSSASATKRPAKSRRSKARSASVYAEEEDDDKMAIDEPLDPETIALHTQACGLLIETMALSRASSLPVSALYKLVMQSQPALKEQRTEREWLRVFDRVLHAGEAGRGSGVFGKVESSGKDKADRPLEAQWFYVPEQDEDQERAALIKAMMPRPAKRSETKKYKQYYWRPVDKLSMWDPEDSL